MISLTVKTTGLEDLDRKLAALEQELLAETLIEEALLEAARDTAEYARNNTKRLTGDIAESIRAVPFRNMSKYMQRQFSAGTKVVVAAFSPAAHLLERGTFKDQPQPFMRPAYESDVASGRLRYRFAASLRRKLIERGIR